MALKGKKKNNEVKFVNHLAMEPKKNLIVEIVFAVLFEVFLMVVYFFSHSWEVLICGLLVPPAWIAYGIYAYRKEQRQDKSSEKDKQEFLSGAKYRQKEWKAAYYDYKEKHSFEEISPKGMKHDLLRRYRIRKNRGLAEAGLVLTAISAAAIVYPVKGFHLGYSILGIVFGGFIMWWGLYSYIGGPVMKFYKTTSDLAEIEKSYNKGKMLSYKVNGINTNGINLGSSYTVIFDADRVIALENKTIEDMVGKMVRVKKYEDSVYSGQEYNYSVSVIYREPWGKESHIDVRLDEFQCEMMIAEFHRSFYPDRQYDPIAEQDIENHVSAP